MPATHATIYLNDFSRRNRRQQWKMMTHLRYQASLIIFSYIFYFEWESNLQSDTYTGTSQIFRIRIQSQLLQKPFIHMCCRNLTLVIALILQHRIPPTAPLINTHSSSSQVGNENVLLETDCSKERIPGSLCLLCHVRETM